LPDVPDLREGYDTYDGRCQRLATLPGVRIDRHAVRFAAGFDRLLDLTRCR